MDKKLLGQRIRAARENVGLSQVELAKLVHRDQRAISTIESGARKIAAHEIPTYAEALQVPIIYFYEGEYQAGDLEIMLLKAFHNIPTDEGKLQALQLVHLLSQPPSIPRELE